LAEDEVEQVLDYDGLNVWSTLESNLSTPTIGSHSSHIQVFDHSSDKLQVGLHNLDNSDSLVVAESHDLDKFEHLALLTLYAHPHAELQLR
jgi:hypothetical protein